LRGVVRLQLRDPAHTRVLGVTVSLRRLFMAVTDPSEIISALTPVPVTSESAS
jgi:hypothetical protein